MIESQPDSVWFKDQGGKRSLLSTVVASPVPLAAPVPLICRLLLENGSVLDDQRSILELPTLGHSDMLALGPEMMRVTIEFRILKVSRNFDNARFVLEIVPDYSKLAAAEQPEVKLGCCRTFPILVKSKRRRPGQHSSAGASSAAEQDEPSSPVAAHSHEEASSHDDPSEVTNALLRELITEQRRHASLLTSVLATQNMIMSSIRSMVGAPRTAPPMPAMFPDTMPVDPPTPSLFRREGTDSSIGSTGTDHSELSAVSMRIPDVPTSVSSSSAASYGTVFFPAFHSHSGGGSMEQLAAVAEAAQSSSKRVCQRYIG